MRAAQRADPEVIRRRGTCSKGVVDRVNVTDNQTSVVSEALFLLRVISKNGFDPILQMVCRDRNRIAIPERYPGERPHWGINNILVYPGPCSIRRSPPNEECV